MNKSTSKTLIEIVNAAAERFDKRPQYRASVKARAELKASAPEPTQGSGSSNARTTEKQDR